MDGGRRRSDEPALTPLQQQLVVVQMELARVGSSRAQQHETARRRVTRIASALGMIAAAVALYDLFLLANFGPS
jgi:hypothetical protein